MRTIRMLLVLAVIGVAAHAQENADWLYPSDFGKRDPFTFAVAQVPVDEPRVNPKAVKGDLEHAEAAMLAEHPREALRACEAGLEKLQGKLAPEDRAKLELTRERLDKIYTAAKRLVDREDAERALKAMRVKVTGIVAAPRGGIALIAGEPYKVGEQVKIEGLSPGPVIERIEPGRILVTYKGVRMEMDVSN